MARNHSPAGSITGRAAGMIVVASLLTSVVIYSRLCRPSTPEFFFRLQRKTNSNSTVISVPKNDLEIALRRASMANKTVIISVLNEAYAEENGLLDLFLRAFHEGEDTEFLIKHLLLVAVDEVAFLRCKQLRLQCYQLVTEGLDFSKEVLFMSEDFNKMMWRRTLLLGDILRLGYNFIFTDMDVLWVRNPLPKLSHDGDDMQLSCDNYNNHPYDESNPINTGFYFAASNNKTIALFEEWYANRKNSTGLKEQDVLSRMKYEGAFRRLGMKVRFLDTLYFSGFCHDSKDFREVRTVHATCCRLVTAKLADLTAALNIWKKFNGTSNATWPAHSACHEAWQKNLINYELQKILERTSMRNKTLIVSFLNKAYSEKNGMLDIFLRSLEQGVDTESLTSHILFVAVDQAAFNRCKLLKLHCYQLVTDRVDFSKDQLLTTEQFNKVTQKRIHFLGDVLKLGYSFIFTELDVMWLRNPLSYLTRSREDMQISCDTYNGNPYDVLNPINTGFYFVVSNNKTTSLFDNWYGFGNWYASRNNSAGIKDHDTLNIMRRNGAFKQLGLKVKFLDTRYFSDLCQATKNFREVITVNANCCSSMNAKIEDLRALLEVSKITDTTAASWPEHKACCQSRSMEK